MRVCPIVMQVHGIDVKACQRERLEDRIRELETALERITQTCDVWHAGNSYAAKTIAQEALGLGKGDAK
jgi:hypothetical protein